ncbi:MAG: hypothetical protein FWB71_05680 [Defluviitaleaceae bacterium]|nr:hypothetical protein [Defluviitaleaceae bacterium]
MLFTEFLDKIENTDDEARFFKQLGNVVDDLKEAKEIPILGKLISAIVYLLELECITEFKQSEHYDVISGWDVIVDLDTGHFSVIPGPGHRKKIFKVAAIIAGILFLIWLCRRKRRKSQD